MKVDLYFKDCLVGQLSEENGKYNFVLDKENYEKVKSFPSVMFAFEVEKLVEGEYDSVPKFFINEFVSNIKQREDIKQKAQIDILDSDMTVLYKFAALNQIDFKFHLKQGK